MVRLVLIFSVILLFQTIGFGQVKLKDPLPKEKRSSLCGNAMNQLNEKSILSREFFYNDRMWLDTFSVMLSETSKKKGLIIILSKSKRSFYYLKLIPHIIKFLIEERNIKSNRIIVAFIPTNTEMAFLQLVPKDKNTSELLQDAKYEILSNEEISKLISSKSNKVQHSKIKN